MAADLHLVVEPAEKVHVTVGGDAYEVTGAIHTGAAAAKGLRRTARRFPGDD